MVRMGRLVREVQSEGEEGVVTIITDQLKQIFYNIITIVRILIAFGFYKLSQYTPDQISPLEVNIPNKPIHQSHDTDDNLFI